MTAHNTLRQLHVDTAALVWDSQLSTDAQQWAETLVDTGTFRHSHAAGVGENLYSKTSSSAAVCSEALLNWFV